MRFLRTVLLIALITSSYVAAKPSEAPSEWPVGSIWRITISDGAKIQVVTVRVDAKEASSCMSGDWRRLKRIAGSYKGVSEPAYMLSKGHLRILLASDICDAYDQLDGVVKNGHFSGRHSSFGFGGGKDLGRAIAVRVK